MSTSAASSLSAPSPIADPCTAMSAGPLSARNGDDETCSVSPSLPSLLPLGPHVPRTVLWRLTQALLRHEQENEQRAQPKEDPEETLPEQSKISVDPPLEWTQQSQCPCPACFTGVGGLNHQNANNQDGPQLDIVCQAATTAHEKDQKSVSPHDNNNNNKTNPSSSSPQNDKNPSNNKNNNLLHWPLRPQQVNLGPGAVFLLDLSGYTKFVASCQGGADQVLQTLNPLFAQMIQIVHSYRGTQILKFCGDALLCSCFMENDNNDESHENDKALLALETAIACSLEVQETVFLQPTRQGRAPPLSLHVGVAASTGDSSDFHELFVGAGRYEHFLTGEPLQVLGDAVDAATSGQVVVHAQNAPQVKLLMDKGWIQGTFVDDNDQSCLVQTAARASELKGQPAQQSAQPSLPALLAQQSPTTRQTLNTALTSFVPTGVPHTAEFRTCSIGFAALPQSSPNDNQNNNNNNNNDTFDQTQTIVQELQRLLAKAGGAILQLLRDDKGTTAIFIFGLPTMSHEDDAARAILTALQLVQRTAVQSVGVATGDVLTGLVGAAATRCSYSAVGDPANLAARLMCACPKLGHKVLVASETQAAAERHSERLDLTESYTIPLKGKGEQTVFVPKWVARKRNNAAFGKKSHYYQRNGSTNSSSGEMKIDPDETETSYNDISQSEGGMDFMMVQEATTTPQQAMVRGAELQKIQQHLQTTAGGGGGSVCLLADAGAGKSTLASTFADHAISSQLVHSVVYAATDATERETPFFTFQYLLQDLCEAFQQQQSAKSGVEAVFEHVGLPKQQAPLLNSLLEPSARIPSNSYCDKLNQKGQRELTVQAVTTILEHIVQYDAISDIAKDNKNKTLQPKLLCVEDLHWMDSLSCQVLTTLLQRDSCSILMTARTLPPNLDKSDISLVLPLQPLTMQEAQTVAFSLGSRLSQEELETLYERSGGNALFFSEMIRATQNSSGENKNNLYSIPTTVRGVLISRIDSLSPACIDFVKAASVFGRAFSAQTTAELLAKKLGDDEMDSMLSSIVSTGLVERVASRRHSLRNLFNTHLDHHGSLRFVHALGGEAAYSLIPQSDVATFHDKAAHLVRTPELMEYHRVRSVRATATSERAILAVQSLSDGTRDKMARGAMDLQRARERWSDARSILALVENVETRRTLELNLTLDEGRAFTAWEGFASDEAGRLFSSALSLTKRGVEKESEVMALSGMWMNAMSNIKTTEGAKKSLAYAEELKALAINPDSITDKSNEMTWLDRECYHVVWTEYGRRGRVREMKRFLDPLLNSLTPHGYQSVLGHNAETCATVFGSKVAWLSGNFSGALDIARSGMFLTEEAVSVAHSHIWGVALLLVWNGQFDEFETFMAKEAPQSLPPYHRCILALLQLHRDTIRDDVSFEEIYDQFVPNIPLPWGEYPFTICYALIRRGYEMKLDSPANPQKLDNQNEREKCCAALRQILSYWKSLRGISDGWGPGLFEWATAMLHLFENPWSDSNVDLAVGAFDQGCRAARTEDAVGVLLFIESSRVKMLLQQRQNHYPAKALVLLQNIREQCQGQSESVAILAFADNVLERGQSRKTSTPWFSSFFSNNCGMRRIHAKEVRTEVADD